MLLLLPGGRERGYLCGHLLSPSAPYLAPAHRRVRAQPPLHSALQITEVVEMNQPYFSPSIPQQQAVTSHQLPPVYLTDLTRTIGVLQQLQVLCASTQVDVSLDDVIQVIRQMQCEFGERSQLEQVIQSLV